MILLLFPFLSFRGIFGIDFGSEYIKVSTALPGKGIHIALNQQSKRLTPSYFAIWNICDPKNTQIPEGSHWNISDLDNMSWAYFDQAKSHAQRFPQNAVKGFTPVLGTRNGMTNREILALTLRELVSTIDDGQWKPEGSSVVLTVEPTLPRADRIALVEAVYLSNMTLTGIVEAPTAAAHVYALEKSYLFENSSKIVAFFDIGAFHTWVSVFRFTSEGKSPVTVEQLAVSYNYSLGAYLMDKALAESMLQKFRETTGVEVTNERTIRQFYAEARRVKELLTVNKDVDVRMEDIIDDLGLNYKQTRHDFNGMIREFNLSLHSLFDDVVARAKLSASEVDSIELLGGTTRVPFVQKSLMDVSGMNKLNRTMNSDEAIALGAGYIAAAKSSSFVIKPVHIYPIVGVNVTLVCPDRQELVLFNETSSVNDRHVLNMTLMQMLGEFVVRCNDVNVTIFSIVPPENVTFDQVFHVYFYFNQFTIPVAGAYYMNGTVRKTCEMKYGFPSWRMTYNEMTQSSMFIRTMERIMKDRATLQQVRNDYESYIYHLKDQLLYDSAFGSVITEDEKKSLTEAVEEHQEWLFGSAQEHAHVFEFSKRLADLKKLAEGTERRADQFQKLPHAMEELNRTLKDVQQTLLTWQDEKPWLFELPQGKRLSEKYTETEKWYNEKCIPQMERPPSEDREIKAEEVDDARIRLQELSKIAGRAVKPSPTPSPEKIIPEETKDDDRYVPVDVTGYDNDDL